MASVDVDLEAGPLSLELSAGLKAMSDRIDRLYELLKHRQERDARFYRVAGNCQTGAAFTGSGPIALLIGRPPAGRIWVVQWCICWVGTNVAAGATANLNCAVMFGRAPAGESATYNVANANVPVSVGDVVIATQAVPPPPTGMPDVGIVKSSQQLYLLIGGSGLAASTTYNGQAGVVDIPDEPGAVLYH